MLIKNLPADEDDCWGIAWRLALIGVASAPSTDRKVLISDSQDNLRMQNFVRDWANEGYEPAIRTWARVVAARLAGEQK